MGIDTKGYLNANITASDIYNVITTKFDKEAAFHVRKEQDGEIGSIIFTYKDERRSVFYCVTSDRLPETEFDGVKHVSLIMGYEEGSVDIMAGIVRHFGGYVDENDCDDIEAIYIEKDGETSHSEYVNERNKIVAVLDDNLNETTKYQIAAQILKHKEKLKELL